MSTEQEIIFRAREAFDAHDDAKEALRVAEARINTLCREYSLEKRLWGYAPYMLRNEVNNRLGQRMA